MAEVPFTLEKCYNIVRDRLGILHDGNRNYQEATFIADAETLGKHIHSILVSAGDRYYDLLTTDKTITASTEKTDLFPDERGEVSEIRRIWLLDGEGRLLTPLQHKSVDAANIWTGTNPSYEVINNEVYWFPPPDRAITVKVEFVRGYNTTPQTDYSASATDSDQIDETGDTPDIPEYARDYFLNELTVRAGVALKQNVSQWMTLAMKSRETMVMNAARNVPRRKWVLYGGR